MEQLITPEALITVPVASGVVALVLFILRGVFTTMWVDRVNRIAAFVLSEGAIVGSLAYMGAEDPFAWVAAAFTGLIVTWAVITGGDELVKRIIAQYTKDTVTPK